MTSNNELYLEIVNFMKDATEEQLTETAITAVNDFWDAYPVNDYMSKLMGLLICAKLGVSHDSSLNEKEKKLIKTVFRKYCKGSIEQIYEFVEKEVTQDDVNDVAGIVAGPDNPHAVPIIYFMLSLAYIDGVIDKEVSDILEKMYEISLNTDYSEYDDYDTTAKSREEIKAEIKSYILEHREPDCAYYYDDCPLVLEYSDIGDNGKCYLSTPFDYWDMDFNEEETDIQVQWEKLLCEISNELGKKYGAPVCSILFREDDYDDFL